MRPLALQLERVFDLRQANRRSLRRASKFEEASTRYLAYPFPNQTSVRLNRPGSHAVLLLFQAANGLLRGSEKVGHALVLLSQSVAAFTEKNHIFEKTHLFSMRRG